MSTNTAKRLGYGGSVVIDGIQCLITSGSFDEAGSVSYLEYLDIKPVQNSRSRVKHADGIRQFSGSVSFDVSVKSIDLFTTTRLFERRYKIDQIGIHDGENNYRMRDCYITNISLSGAPGGLIAASLSFIATEGREVAYVTDDYVLNYTSDPTNQPAAYWWSGQVDVRDWNFTYTQDAQPVYSNEDTREPRYIRVGLVTYSLNTTVYSDWEHSSISVITKSFSLTGDTTSKGYTFNGPTDLGMYSHTFETAADATVGSDDIIIT